MSFVQLLLLVASALLMTVTVIEAKKYGRCDLARELRDTKQFPKKELATWVCLIEAESSRNSDLVERSDSDGSSNYGLFQINSRYWCSGGPKSDYNNCKISCDDLTDDDISDDAKCAKQIFNRHGFSAWNAWTSKCKGKDVSKYIKNCKV